MFDITVLPGDLEYRSSCIEYAYKYALSWLLVIGKVVAVVRKSVPKREF